jgi:DNA-binding LytR/AlgR family response regulator
MAGAHDDPFVQPVAAPRVVSRRRSNAYRWMMGLLLLLIGISGIAGVAVAMSVGQPTVAILIALVVGAIFAGISC